MYKHIRIKGFQGVTLLDYPDKVASTIFLGGCNFKCPSCHNPELIDINELPDIDEEVVFSDIGKRKNFIEGICITGGEPLLFDEVIKFIEDIKSRTDKKVKIDTNGYNPALLKKIIDLKIVDYIAMDIKTSLKKYYIAAGVGIKDEIIKESIELLLSGNIEYEFRNTCVPELVTFDDIREIGVLISGAKKMSIQQFKNTKTFSDEFLKVRPYKPEELKKFRDILIQYVPSVDIRGI